MAGHKIYETYIKKMWKYMEKGGRLAPQTLISVTASGL